MDARLSPFDLAVDSAGTVYVAGAFAARVYRLSPVPFSLARVGSLRTNAFGSNYYSLTIAPFPPLTGRIGVEPRTSSAGSYYIYFHFTGFVFGVPGVSVVDHNMLPVNAMIGFVGTGSGGRNLVGVTLSNVQDKSRVSITLTGVNGDEPYQTSIGFLIGDVNGDGIVDASDISIVKSRSGLVPLNGHPDLVKDINVSGKVTAADIAAVKARIGNALPQ